MDNAYGERNVLIPNIRVHPGSGGPIELGPLGMTALGSGDLREWRPQTEEVHDGILSFQCPLEFTLYTVNFYMAFYHHYYWLSESWIDTNPTNPSAAKGE